MAYLRQLNGKDVRITTLYVKPLSGQDQAQELRHDDILNYFSAFGDITSVRLRHKPKRSYGFVKFNQPESAAKALQTEIHTVAGRKVEIDAAHARYQDWVSLLDLNNDCLRGIFSENCLSVEDLCSVAETSRRLKEIAVQVFRRQYKKCNLSIPETVECSKRSELANVRVDGVVSKRILVNFGSVMSELEIYGFDFDINKRTDILDSVARYCSDSLESLTLEWFNIPGSFADKMQPIFKNLQKCKMTSCSFEGASKELFAECPGMVELIVYNGRDMTFITEKTFPKLQHFEYKSWNWSAQLEINFESFLSRHRNLQVLYIGGFNEGSSLLRSIADNCRRLEQLQFVMPAKDSAVDLSNFIHLRKLKIGFALRRYLDTSILDTSILRWNNLNFLVEIKFENMNIDSEFVRYLSQLKGLQVLEVEDCTGIQNLQQIDDKNQLTKLKISGCNDEINFDWARLIQRLGNLKCLHLDLRKFDSLDNFYSLDNFDTETSLRIVEIVGRRPQKSKLRFRVGIDCEYGTLQTEPYGQLKRNDVFYQNRHLVEMLIVCENCGLTVN